MFGSKLETSSGTTVEIVDPGSHNEDAGPDFASATIRHDGLEWAGNVEIHIKASDWEKHGHHLDKAYDSVILHVVGVDDTSVKRSDGSEILQVCVTPSPEFYQRYALLTDKIDLPTCLPWLNTIPILNRCDWMSALGVERLQDKARYMLSIYEAGQGDWQQAVFVILSRALGFGLNGVPFELLAKSIPLNFAMRHRDNPFQIEAMLFGQAGLLRSGTYEYDSYYMQLCREYEFLRQKYCLTPLPADLWKYSRTRPQNFPHRRIAILAKMVADGMQIFSQILEAEGDYDILMSLLDAEASPYWRHHSRFGESEREDILPVALSRSSKEIILINVMAPFYFAYGSVTGNPDFAEKGLDLLNAIKPEKNSIIALWERHGLKCENAFDSQALIHLRKKYCDSSRCLECRFGHWLLRKTI